MTGTTLNPADSYDQLTFSNGDLTIASSAGGTWNSAAPTCRSTTHKSTGKIYFETTINIALGGGFLIGLANATYNMATNASYPGYDLNAFGYYSIDGGIYINGAHAVSGPTYAVGDTVGQAIDFAAQRLWVRNTSAPTVWNTGGTDDPATGLGGFDISTLAAGPYYVCPSPLVQPSGGTMTVNFGPSAGFAASVPSGFLAWDTPNATTQPIVMIVIST